MMSILRFSKVLGFIAILGFVSSAQAERYLVIMKNKSSFAKFQKQVSQAPLSFSQMNSAQVENSLESLQSYVVHADTEAQVAELQNLPGVLMVEKEIFHPAPRPVEGFRLTQAWDFDLSFATPNARTLSGQKQPWGIATVKAPQAWLTTQGSGARVLILDTGVDKDHPALKANLEETKDFVHDNNLPYEAADKVGHGTHVAGTIAGVKSVDGFAGVAPKAKMLMGRVCSTDGCSNIAVAEGINWGIQKKVHLISMSLGGPFASNAEKLAIEKAEQMGVTVVAASGNDGTARVAYPAAFPSVIAVGALDSGLKKASFSQWGPELDIAAPGVGVVSAVPVGSGRESLVQLSLDGTLKDVNSAGFVGGKQVLTGVSNKLVAAGLGKPEDFAKVNVDGKFALVQRGDIKFIDKVQNALAAKAAGVVIYNNAEGLVQGSLTEDGSELSIPVVMIEQLVGEKAVQILNSGRDVQVMLKTLATDYASFSGTSMATPHVAGVVALMKSVKPDLTTTQVRDILKATATPLSPNDQNQVGAGLIDAEKAVNAAGLAR